jgi:UDP-N-acetylglucosamine 2-epimerase (non-hydrolysing)
MIKKILVVFGTRPEAIKMAPVVRELENYFNVEVCVTAQHRQMLDQVLHLFEIEPKYDLDLMKEGQDLFDITANVLQGMKEVLLSSKPDLVLVHGDTTTTMATSMAAFYLKVPIGHVEAGLRTNDIYSPFPEEFNRQLTTKVTQFHFAPTDRAKNNLLREGEPEENIFVTGNTVIDTLKSIVERARKTPFTVQLSKQLPFINELKNERSKIILVTGHRRENFGKGFEDICCALSEIAHAHPEVQIVYPVHLNPNVQEPVNLILSGIKNIHLIEPLDYIPFVKLMDASYIILTDSGGIQEEAPSLGKPVLVMRNTTERQEAIEAGTVKLVGTCKDTIVKETLSLLNNKEKYEGMARAHNPFGDGLASKKIRQILKR